MIAESFGLPSCTCACLRSVCAFPNRSFSWTQRFHPSTSYRIPLARRCRLRPLVRCSRPRRPDPTELPTPITGSREQSNTPTPTILPCTLRGTAPIARFRAERPRKGTQSQARGSTSIGEEAGLPAPAPGCCLSPPYASEHRAEANRTVTDTGEANRTVTDTGRANRTQDGLTASPWLLLMNRRRSLRLRRRHRRSRRLSSPRPGRSGGGAPRCDGPALLRGASRP